jgi:hypothetical protein
MPLGELVQRRALLAAGAPTSAEARAAPEVPTRHGADDDPDAREHLRVFLADFARELGDEAPLSSTITRTLHIFTTAKVPPERWSDLLYQARGLTQEHTASIRKLATSNGDQLRRKNKMPYFLATLEQLAGLRPDASTTASVRAKKET